MAGKRSASETPEVVRSTSPIAVRGSSFRLRRGVDEARGWSVEEVGDDRVETGHSFALEEIGAAVDLLDRSYLSILAGREDASALVTALEWGLAHRAGDVEAVGSLMADGSSLYDRRHLGLGEVSRDQLLALLDARWETNSVALVAEYEKWNERAVLARVIYVGHADWDLIEGSESYTLFALDPDGDGDAGRILRMDVYDGTADGRAAALERFDDLLRHTP